MTRAAMNAAARVACEYSHCLRRSGQFAGRIVQLFVARLAGYVNVKKMLINRIVCSAIFVRPSQTWFRTKRIQRRISKCEKFQLQFRNAPERGTREPTARCAPLASDADLDPVAQVRLSQKVNR